MYIPANFWSTQNRPCYLKIHNSFYRYMMLLKNNIFLPTPIFENIVQFCKNHIFTKKCSSAFRIVSLDKFRSMAKSTALSPKTCPYLMKTDH